MAFIALNDLGTRRLIRSYDLPQLFRVELRREGRGTDEITEHYRQLATLSFRRTCFCRWRRYAGGNRDWLLASYPDQKAPLFLGREPLSADKLFLEVFEIRVIERELALEGPIRHPPLALEQGHDLVEHLIEVHHC